jgi:large subunit ribosomal protein L41
MRPTQPLFGPGLRRLPLTTKSARKGYYKGTGVGILGHWDPANPRKFVIDWDKIKTYKVPEKGMNLAASEVR